MKCTVDEWLISPFAIAAHLDRSVTFADMTVDDFDEQ